MCASDGCPSLPAASLLTAPSLPPPPADPAHPPVTVSEFTERMAILRSSMDEGLDDEYAVSTSCC